MTGRRRIWLATAVLLLVFLCVPASGESGTGIGGNDGDLPEWTVLFYFCGSDLESKYGYATENLQEILTVCYPYDYSKLVGTAESTETGEVPRSSTEVNILVETGGSREWHTEELNMDVNVNALQRWRYDYTNSDDPFFMDEVSTFELVDEVPLRSMAESETLTDFIRWGMQNYPARKTALILWGHGDGARTGMLIDELFDGDVMYLYELRQALADSGAHFDTVVIDACLMANVETAWNIREYADWMVASQETVPGRGTAINQWLQELANYPAMDGEWLGRSVCDTTAVKYANDTNEKGRMMLTWSVIDLSRIDRLTEKLELLAGKLGEMLAQNPMLAQLNTSFIFGVQEYGDGRQNMRDLGSVLYHEHIIYFMDHELLTDLVGALSDAVVYMTRGSGRSEARGLSFCYPADFSAEELNGYAMNYPMPRYLAFLDAVSAGWTAEDWVYEKTARLPEIGSIEGMQIRGIKMFSSDGMPAIAFNLNKAVMMDVYYSLYHLEEDTGELIRLGRTSCRAEGATDDPQSNWIVWRASDPMHWPAVDGTLCTIELVKDSGNQRLYNVPVQINSEISVLRCGRIITYLEDYTILGNEYEIYGVWEGYDENTELMNRSVKPLSMLAGRKYRLLYPRDTAKGDRVYYSMSGEKTMYSRLEVKEIPLPAGTYYLEYEIRDMFMRTVKLERIEIHWDGQEMSFPEGFSWDGDAQFRWEEQR